MTPLKDRASTYGAICHPDGTCSWRVWAPQAGQVNLLLSSPSGETKTFPMEKSGEDFELHLPGIAEGTRYGYSVDGGPLRPDPVSRWQPESVHTSSAVFSPDNFAWQCGDWQGVPRDELVIYELHTGTFTREGTFAAIVPRLATLKELGITAIELMPVSQFPGTRNWGYDGVFPYAVQNSYGGPQGLQAFVDECHAHGIGVILDVVYNHLGPEGNYLSEFGPYFSDRHSTPWGRAVNFDGPHSEGVRQFVLQNVRQWLRDFRVDGLRLDAVHAIIDDSPQHILAEIQQTANAEGEARGWPAHIIAESNLNDPRILDCPERGGYGLDAQWNDDFHHAVHVLLTNELEGYYADFEVPTRQLEKVYNDFFVLDGRYSKFRGRKHGDSVRHLSGDRFVVSLQTHDQCGNRPQGDRLHTMVTPQAQRLGACLLLLSPNIPMLFMGEEYGETRPFPFFCDFGDLALQEAVRNGRLEEFKDSHWVQEPFDPQSPQTYDCAKLSWYWPEETEQAGLRRLYTELTAARRRFLPLHDFVHRKAELLDNSILLLRRGDGDYPERQVVAAFNLTMNTLTFSGPSAATHRILLRSEDPRFGGEHRRGTDDETLHPYECIVVVPASDPQSHKSLNMPNLAHSSRKTSLMAVDSTGTSFSASGGSDYSSSKNLQPLLTEILDRVQACIDQQRLPVATYRLQMNRDFTLRRAIEFVPYLAELGIRDVYSSPLLKATSGSNHGYDVVAHDRINPEIGTEEDLREFSAVLKHKGMRLILDIVPNHMSVATAENAWWNDVLENGPSSPYSHYFDIDWMPIKSDLANKVLLPVLGEQFGKVLEEGLLKLIYEEGAFFLNVYELRYPIAPRSYQKILSHRLEHLQQTLDTNSPELSEYLSILTAIGNLPHNTETIPEKLEERRRETEVIKRRLRELVGRSPEIESFLQTSLQEINGEPAVPGSYDLLDDILQLQCYRLAYWRVAADEINYRRFFDINSLAAICVELPEVFEATHKLIFEWLDQGLIDGLRIDHPDGLFDPEGYLRQIQRRRFAQLCEKVLAEAESAAEDRLELKGALMAHWDDLPSRAKTPLTRPLYMVVEKILEHGEPFPADWAVHGTVGYEFLNALNGICVDPQGEKGLSATYSRFTGFSNDFGELAYLCKRLNVRNSMASELNVLAHRLDRISEQNRWTRDFTLNGLTRTLQELIACFGIYRTYVQRGKVSPRDRRFILQAIAQAKARQREMNEPAFDFLRDMLLLEARANSGDDERQAAELFVGKFQQLTGPIMAKAIEDTAFYRYGRLISLNEVGGSPDHFGTDLQEFHALNRRRLPAFSHGLSSTSTHDTKRSEDVRARIDVLSEIPREWSQAVSRWNRRNQACKTTLEGGYGPSRNDEYLLYQTMIGAWPEEGMTERTVERLQQYLVKAVREAKLSSSWINPNSDYEDACRKFITRICDSEHRHGFLKDIEAFALKVRIHGRWNSIAQLLLKIVSPGVPDFYQGSELELLTLVDPDNRSPVNEGLHRRMLETLLVLEAQPPQQMCETLLLSESFDLLKLHVTRQGLHLRKEHPDLFTAGEYLPLQVQGLHADCVVAVARKQENSIVLAVVPRWTVRISGFGGPAPLGESWGDTEIMLPQEFRGLSFRDSLTQTSWTGAEVIRLSDLFRSLPASLSVSVSGAE
ncbi:MAG: malto-oligosyltrehalose synthase [Planctomycetales bacterium]